MAANYELWSNFRPYSDRQHGNQQHRPALDDYGMGAPELNQPHWSPVGRSSNKPDWDSDFMDYGSLRRRDVPVRGSSSSGSRPGSGRARDVPVYPKHAAHESVGGAPGLAHAWESHHVLSWARVSGLGDLVANFRAAKLSGEDLLQLVPKDVAETLKISKDDDAFRVCAALAHLKERWRMARRKAGLKASLDAPAAARAKRLVADLHVLISGAAVLPPGATGAYVLLELGEHHARSSFVPALNPMSPNSPLGGGGGGGGMMHESGFLLHNPPLDGKYQLYPAAEDAIAGAHPQTFKLTIDEDTIKDASSLLLDVIAWFPQVGELSIGRVEVPMPEGGSPSMRLRLEEPLGIELHWRAYGAPASPGKDAWEEEYAEPLYPPYAYEQGLGGMTW